MPNTKLRFATLWSVNMEQTDCVRIGISYFSTTAITSAVICEMLSNYTDTRPPKNVKFQKLYFRFGRSVIVLQLSQMEKLRVMLRVTSISLLSSLVCLSNFSRKNPLTLFCLVKHVRRKNSLLFSKKANLMSFVPIMLRVQKALDVRFPYPLRLTIDFVSDSQVLAEKILSLLIPCYLQQNTFLTKQIYAGDRR